VAAYARTLATNRHRNVTLAEQAVIESRAFSEQEALSASRQSALCEQRPLLRFQKRLRWLYCQRGLLISQLKRIVKDELPS
jgi:hypothetical protein